MNPCSKILDYLYLGGESESKDLEYLNKHNIKNIISIVKNPKKEFPTINYYLISEMDDAKTDLKKYFYKSCRFIHKSRCKKQSVLVHCQAGISRSATIVLAYLMTIYKSTLADVYEFLAFKRKCIEPNFSFLSQLNEFGDNHENEKLYDGLLIEMPISIEQINKDTIEYRCFHDKRADKIPKTDCKTHGDDGHRSHLKERPLIPFELGNISRNIIYQKRVANTSLSRPKLEQVNVESLESTPRKQGCSSQHSLPNEKLN